jgi:hypothetical protein
MKKREIFSTMVWTKKELKPQSGFMCRKMQVIVNLASITDGVN